MAALDLGPRGPNGGLLVDPKLYYDPNDERRPQLDLAAPTEEEIKEYHSAVYGYPEGSSPRPLDLLCVGTGMAGITVAMLAQWRLKNVTLKIMEKNAKPVGTWYINKYPGCRCDLAAHYYTWRWELTNWTAEYVESDEIYGYFSRMAKKYNVDAFATYNATIEAFTWSEERQAWRVDVKTPEGMKTDWAHVIINGHGVLDRPNIPIFPGEEKFKGKVLHTARYDRSVPLEGKKVAVIGNGSSGIQTIGTIFRTVKALYSFQRNPTWISNQLGETDKIDVHRFSKEEMERYADRAYHSDYYKFNFREMDRSYNMFVLGSRTSAKATRLARELMDKHVKDPELRKMLTPNFPVGCRRPTPHEYYLEALQAPQTTIVTKHIEHFTENGIVAGGVEYPCDVVIKATGFNVSYTPTFQVTGRNGMTLQKLWADFPFTYKSVMSSGFPNFFHIMGPNAPVASQSIHMLEEQQINFAFQILMRMQTTDITAVDPQSHVETAWNDQIQQNLKGTIWNLDCGGWYKHKSGRLVSHYPGPSLAYMDEIRTPNWGELNVTTLKDMRDPSQNKIESVFGASVEEVARSNNPAPPNKELVKKWGKYKFVPPMQPARAPRQEQPSAGKL